MIARAARCGLALLLASLGPVQAQTTENPQALDQLSPPPAAHQSAPKRTTHATPRKPSRPPVHTGGKPNPHAMLHPVPPAKPAATAMPANAPPAPVLPPPIVVPMRPLPPPPTPPVAADAPGNAIPQPGGERVTFGVGRADLNPATDAALRALAHTGPPFAATTFSVTAYAAGDADDPSTPRRLSLARALAVRSVLIAEGVPSTRIYVRALGASVPPGDSPPDRVDIVAIAPKPAQQAPASPP